MRKLLAIVYGCWSNGQWFDPTFEERLKARHKNSAQKGDLEEKAQVEDERPDASGQHTGGVDMRAPVS